ncbi:MAG TPA: geranylgeranylglyceryl/heptaprenylglyceryl phosphate synthase [Candidatus Thermoplasmatota archaeon]|jgi:phosphoglycerol geranylgeranyltransferase|nr:geranylgeranylglyceryl/heptaprenylglyceryl phosphate synthase [Candidatus Thermoplasmatota archaeon]
MKGKVARYLEERTAKGPVHMTLLDPASVSAERGVEIARRAQDFGTDCFMVGGSTGVTEANLDSLVVGIKEATGLPVIHFPNHHGAISRHVDAIWFMSMLNSRDPRFITREQMLGAPILKVLKIEPLSMGYVIVAPGMTVGRVSDAEVLARTDEGAEMAAAYALAAEFFGMQFVYLEAGSGADQPIPEGHVRAVKAATATIRCVAGGGIRTAAQATTLLDAGADVLVTGTIAEEQEYAALRGIVKAVRAHQR